MIKEPKSLKEARYVMFAAAGELFAAHNSNVKDIGPYLMARDIARENYRDEYEKFYGKRPREERFEQLELSI